MMMWRKRMRGGGLGGCICVCTVFSPRVEKKMMRKERNHYHPLLFLTSWLKVEADEEQEKRGTGIMYDHQNTVSQREYEKRWYEGSRCMRNEWMNSRLFVWENYERHEDSIHTEMYRGLKSALRYTRLWCRLCAIFHFITNTTNSSQTVCVNSGTTPGLPPSRMKKTRWEEATMMFMMMIPGIR